MLKLICLFTFLAMTLSSKVLGPVSSALTIYNGGQSLVKDVRQVLYDKPKSTLFFNKIASTIQPDTLIINPGNSGVRIYETSFDNGTRGQGKFATLKNYINKTISFKSGDNVTRRGKLIAFGNELTNQGGSVQYGNNFINQGNPVASGADFIKIINPLTGHTQMYDSFNNLKLPTLKINQIKQPSIIFTAGVSAPIISPTQASYRATGLSWTASYAIYLYPDETRANLSGYVNIDNKSGKNFTNTTLSLMTGQVKTIQQPLQEQAYASYQLSEKAQPSVSQPTFTPQPISDYHMYSLNRKVNVTDGSNKQIQLFNMVYGAAVNKQYTATVDSGANPQDVRFVTEFTVRNRKENNGLGGALPGGVVRVFKRDARGATQFVGEDSTGHVAQGQNMTIRTGSPFDLQAKYTVLNKKDIPVPIKQNNFTQMRDFGHYSAKLQLQITNSALRPASIQLTLKNQQNLQISYDAGYTGPRWQKIDANTYKIKTTLNGNSMGSVYWNEMVSK